MANMSEAFGNITIFCASFDALVDLIQCHLKYEKEAYYSTALDLFEDVSPENRTEIIKIVEENYELDSTTHDAMLVSDFTAMGRWSFNSNIGWFFGCLTEDYSKYPNIDEAQSRAKATDITVEFDFTDGESGCDFIQDGEISINWDAKNQKQVENSDTTETVSYTVQNLLDYNFYDFGEVVSSKWLLTHFDEYVDRMCDDDEKEVFKTFKDRILALLKEHETSREAFGDSEDIYDSFDDCLYNIGDNGIALLEDMGLD